jgi:hypothetical protein
MLLALINGTFQRPILKSVLIKYVKVNKVSLIIQVKLKFSRNKLVFISQVYSSPLYFPILLFRTIRRPEDDSLSRGETRRLKIILQSIE